MELQSTKIPYYAKQSAIYGSSALIGMALYAWAQRNWMLGAGSTAAILLFNTALKTTPEIHARRFSKGLVVSLVTAATYAATQRYLPALAVLGVTSFLCVHPGKKTRVPVPLNKDGLDPVIYLSKDTTACVFSHLSANELGRSCLVSKQWRRQLASDQTLWNALDLRKLSPLIRVFDESDWATHVDLDSLGLSTADAPPIDKCKEIPALQRLLSSLPIEGNEGITYLTIPKGLTFNKVVKLAGSPKLGNVTNFSYIWDRITTELGDIPVDKTYRVVITNNVLVGSRNLPVDDQRAVNDQKRLVRKFGCEMPTTVEAITLLVVTHMSSSQQQRLYIEGTYTRTINQVDGFHVLVGGFAPAGPRVYYDRYFFDYDSFGVGGALR